jgi:SAM-dependent methyltransferase
VRRLWRRIYRRLFVLWPRERVARRYLRGEGIEIGALNLPMHTRGRVRYVDYVAVEKLRAQYPYLDEIVAPDVIDDGQTLATIADGSQDFVVASHFLEHCEDPIGTLKTFARVLRRGGHAVVVVPDKRGSFDRERPLTSVSHLIADHRDGPALSRAEHYEEWARLVDHLDDDKTAAFVAHGLESGHHIHFHVWTHETFLELLASVELPFELVAAKGRRHESVVVLRRL